MKLESLCVERTDAGECAKTTGTLCESVFRRNHSLWRRLRYVFLGQGQKFKFGTPEPGLNGEFSFFPIRKNLEPKLNAHKTGVEAIMGYLGAHLGAPQGWVGGSRALKGEPAPRQVPGSSGKLCSKKGLGGIQPGFPAHPTLVIILLSKPVLKIGIHMWAGVKII
ncbi:hypothetical protein ACJJTC_003712 [Scirpophaga incertulas]